MAHLPAKKLIENGFCSKSPSDLALISFELFVQFGDRGATMHVSARHNSCSNGDGISALTFLRVLMTWSSSYWRTMTKSQRITISTTISILLDVLSNARSDDDVALNGENPSQETNSVGQKEEMEESDFSEEKIAAEDDQMSKKRKRYNTFPNELGITQLNGMLVILISIMSPHLQTIVGRSKVVKILFYFHPSHICGRFISFFFSSQTDEK
ncbi:uncharacterized protein LOC131249676 [Magnolia sinica]|uniref:uncharacterized protein LOC131249676 n=1 Tax=Magnolia sinica TaxID=86752 RepID=UPI002659CA56|nr:uncharacterized protein LOC131249676 [Magnolia sinica]